MRKDNRQIVKVVSVIIAVIVIGICLFPLIWMSLAGFKPEKDVMRVPLTFLPKVWTTESFDYLWKDKNFNFLRSMRATFMVSGIAVILVLAVNSMAAYAFARLEFAFKKTIWRILIMTMYIPGITILITSFVMVSDMKITDTYTVLIIPGVATAYNIFFFRQFFLNMPMALEESALIDGASRFRIFLSIFLPNASSPLVILGMGAFVGYWNSFIWPVLTITDNKKYQVMQIIRAFRTTYSNRMGTLMAASFLAALVPISIFLIFQKHIIKGIVLSGIK